MLEQTGPAGMPLSGRGDPTWVLLKRHSAGEPVSVCHDLDTRLEGIADVEVKRWNSL